MNEPPRLLPRPGGLGILAPLPMNKEKADWVGPGTGGAMSEQRLIDQGSPSQLAGNFAAKVENLRLPPLPVSVARLIAEFNRPDPDLDRLVEVIPSTPDVAIKVVQAVNSSIFDLRHPVISVRHAAALLGLHHVGPIALSFSMMSALPRPPEDVFDHEGFWSDSLIRAMFAREFTTRSAPGEEETAFTAALLADLALPILLLAWRQPYAELVAQWRGAPQSLSRMERQAFGWDHAAAGAYILGAWGLPARLGRHIGFHTWEPAEIRRHESSGELDVPVAVAALAPSVQRPQPARAEHFVRVAMAEFGLSPREMVALVAQIRSGFRDVCDLFEIREKRAFVALDRLVAAASLQLGAE